MSILVVDNDSPFTPDILEHLDRLGAKYERKKFSDIEDNIKYDRIILSGRRKNKKEINAINSRIIKHCQKNRIPLLGICYGAEIIALTLGGSIRRMDRQIQEMTEVSVLTPNPLTGDKKLVNVYESHHYCIARLPANFKCLASSKDCQHEIFSDPSNKIYGIQFHPEKSGSDGQALLLNFTKL